MKKFIVVISFLAVSFFSCIDAIPGIGPIDPSAADPIDNTGVKKKTFYVQNFKTNGVPTSVEAGLLVEGKYCHIWVGRGVNITEEKAKSIAKIYDEDIYYKMMYYFSFTEEDEIKFDGEKVNTTLDIVNCLVNGDGKLNIVLADITDNYEKGKNNSYTGGYFWNGDLFKRDVNDPDLRYSNECAAIFIDTYPATPGSEESNSTLAHEMQHLMSFLNSFVYRVEKNELHIFDTWIDEGLSLSAEYLYLERHLTPRVNHYKNDPSGLICKGNNFYVWGNRTDESPYASLDDYATVYLFFQWLRKQTDIDIYSYIMFSSSYNYNVVVDAYNAYNKNNGISVTKSNWDSLLKTWLASNQIKSATGQYGYKGELSDIKAHAAPAQTSINLYPGEGVYSKTSSQPVTSGSGANIKYAYITTADVSASYSANSTLLTYNGNTNLNGGSEKGITTGAASEHIVPDARFMASFYNEPIRIDARDMMGRDKWRESYSNGISGLKGAK
jgi:Peptidase M30.